jgi:hypothetical protein
MERRIQVALTATEWSSASPFNNGGLAEDPEREANVPAADLSG